MASPSAPVHPGRYLAVFLVMLVGVYLLVFLTGNKQADPKLGIDLQGGTRVTLTARTPDGSRPSKEALSQAQQIIGSRVNGLGVSGSEVIVDGDNLVITVPGTDGNEARNLGQTARLYIRPVVNALPVDSAGAQGGPRLPAPRGPRGRVPARTVEHRVHPLPAHQCLGNPGAGSRARAPGGGPGAGPRPAGRPAVAARQPRRPAPAPALSAGRALLADAGAAQTHPAVTGPRTRSRARCNGAARTSAAPAGRSPDRRIPAKTSPSASPRSESGGRAPTRVCNSWRCNMRPPAASRKTSWPATTTPNCRW